MYGLVQPPSRCPKDLDKSVVTCNFRFVAGKGSGPEAELLQWGLDRDCAAHSKAAVGLLWEEAGVQTTRIRRGDYGAVSKDKVKLLVNCLWLWLDC